MMTRNLLVAAVVVAVAPGSLLAAGKDALVVTERDGLYVLSVPAAKAELRFPKAGFERFETSAGGATDSPRYFAFRDTGTGIILSGWMEPKRLYRGFAQRWGEDRARYIAKGLKMEQEVVRKVGDWDCAFYFMILDGGLRQANLRACCVSEGAWFDLHLSHNAPDSSFDVLEATLRSVTVGKKDG
jgi:hypothetical protein